MMDLHGRDFLTLLDFTPEEIGGLLDLAEELKAKKKAGIPHKIHEGKNIALIFEKTSTRTRCSFEVAGRDLGMGVTYLDPAGSQIGKKESIADTARVLSRMFDGIEYRGYGQEIVEELAKYASVPVWNGLTNEFHPTQILADFLTVREHFGKLRGIKLVYLGNARYNMGDSLMVGCAKMGMHFVACAPEGYFPDPALVEKCQKIASLGRAHRGPRPLPGQSRAHGRGGAAGRVSSLSARLPRSQDRDRQGDGREIRETRDGSDGRGFRGAPVPGL